MHRDERDQCRDGDLDVARGLPVRDLPAERPEGADADERERQDEHDPQAGPPASIESSSLASAQAVDATAAATASAMPTVPSSPASFEIRYSGVRSESGHQNHASAATVATAAPATIATPARRVRHMKSAMLAATQAKAARDDAAAHARTRAAADVPAAGVRQPQASAVRTTKRTPMAKRSEPVTDNSQNPIEASGSTSASAVPASPPPARRTVQTSTASASGVRSA